MGTASDVGGDGSEKDGGEVEEVLTISAADAAKLQGTSGSGPGAARLVEQRSRATVSVERGQACLVRVRGPTAAVRKALGMLKALVSFREAAAPEERGLCRWFSSGFCRLTEEGSEGCEDGLHAPDLLRDAQSTWLGKGPVPGVEAVQGVPLLLAAYCNGPGLRGAVDGEEEVTELAVIAICPTTGREVGRFHRFVRPYAWSGDGESGLRQRFHQGCFNPECTAVDFSNVIADLLDWIPALLGVPLDEIRSEDLLLVTARDFEAQSLLPRQCNTPEMGTVDPTLQDFFFCRWACLKDVFRQHFQMSAEDAPKGLRMMLRELGLGSPQERRLTFCMQDCTCMGRIVEELLRSGWQAQPTAWRQTAVAPAEFALPRVGRGGEMAWDSTVKLPPLFPVLPAKRGFEEVDAGVELPAARLPHPPLMQPPVEFPGQFPPPPPGGPGGQFPPPPAGGLPAFQPELAQEIGGPPPAFPPLPPLAFAGGEASAEEVVDVRDVAEAGSGLLPLLPPAQPRAPANPSPPWQGGPVQVALPRPVATSSRATGRPRPPPPWRHQGQGQLPTAGGRPAAQPTTTTEVPLLNNHPKASRPRLSSDGSSGVLPQLEATVEVPVKLRPADAAVATLPPLGDEAEVLEVKPRASHTIPISMPSGPPPPSADELEEEEIEAVD